ncbi:hypothetical protein D3C87_347280 [compost metagenome]
MRTLLFIASSILITGCSSSAYPGLYAGKYYMMGDDDCQFIRPLSDTRVMCMDDDHNDMGYRDAMTRDQLMMYQAQVQMYQAQMASLNQSLNEVNQSLYNNQPSYQFTPVEQPTFSNGWDGTSYRQVGSTMLGSDGKSYRRVGNTILGSDGTNCQIVGSNILCK